MGPYRFTDGAHPEVPTFEYPKSQILISGLVVPSRRVFSNLMSLFATPCRCSSRFGRLYRDTQTWTVAATLQSYPPLLLHALLSPAQHYKRPGSTLHAPASTPACPDLAFLPETVVSVPAAGTLPAGSPCGGSNQWQ